MKVIITLAFILISIPAYQQSAESINSPKKLHRFLKAHPLAFLNPEGTDKIREILPLPKDFRIKGFHLNKGQIVAVENGTGRIISIDSLGNVIRIDATQYGGDRFGSFEFVFRDTLYSMGGYGFWHVNGAVRRFDWATKDWVAIQTNKSIPAAFGVNAIFHFNPEVGRVFVFFEQYPDEYLMPSLNKEKGVHLAVFDLNSKKWDGADYVISTKLMNEISDIRKIAHTTQSLVIHSRFNQNTIEIDLAENKYYTLRGDFLTKYYSLTGQKNIEIFKTEGLKILIGDLFNEQFDTLDTKKYRNTTHYALIEKGAINHKSLGSNSLLIVSVILNVLFASLIIYVFYNRKRNPAVEQSSLFHEAFVKPKMFTDLLDEGETAVLEKIYQNSKSGENTSIDEINKILGLQKRPYKIANNLRADALKLINKKFNDFTNTKDELITRKRSDFDKRFFTYQINERYINKLIFKKNE